METTEKVTTGTYDSLVAQCKNAGITLRKACGLAEVDYHNVRKWKDKEPKTIETINKLNGVISGYRKKK